MTYGRRSRKGRQLFKSLATDKDDVPGEVFVTTPQKQQKDLGEQKSTFPPSPSSCPVCHEKIQNPEMAIRYINEKNRHDTLPHNDERNNENEKSDGTLPSPALFNPNKLLNAVSELIRLQEQQQQQQQQGKSLEEDGHVHNDDHISMDDGEGNNNDDDKSICVSDKNNNVYGKSDAGDNVGDDAIEGLTNFEKDNAGDGATAGIDDAGESPAIVADKNKNDCNFVNDAVESEIAEKKHPKTTITPTRILSRNAFGGRVKTTSTRRKQNRKLNKKKSPHTPAVTNEIFDFHSQSSLPAYDKDGNKGKDGTLLADDDRVADDCEENMAMETSTTTLTATTTTKTSKAIDNEKSAKGSPNENIIDNEKEDNVKSVPSTNKKKKKGNSSSGSGSSRRRRRRRNRRSTSMEEEDNNEDNNEDKNDDDNADDFNSLLPPIIPQHLFSKQPANTAVSSPMVHQPNQEEKEGENKMVENESMRHTGIKDGEMEVYEEDGDNEKQLVPEKTSAPTILLEQKDDKQQSTRSAGHADSQQPDLSSSAIAGPSSPPEKSILANDAKEKESSANIAGGHDGDVNTLPCIEIAQNEETQALPLPIGDYFGKGGNDVSVDKKENKEIKQSSKMKTSPAAESKKKGTNQNGGSPSLPKSSAAVNDGRVNTPSCTQDVVDGETQALPLPLDYSGNKNHHGDKTSEGINQNSNAKESATTCCKEKVDLSSQQSDSVGDVDVVESEKQHQDEDEQILRRSPRKKVSYLPQQEKEQDPDGDGHNDDINNEDEEDDDAMNEDQPLCRRLESAFDAHSSDLAAGGKKKLQEKNAAVLPEKKMCKDDDYGNGALEEYHIDSSDGKVSNNNIDNRENDDVDDNDDDDDAPILKPNKKGSNNVFLSLSLSQQHPSSPSQPEQQQLALSMLQTCTEDDDDDDDNDETYEPGSSSMEDLAPLSETVSPRRITRSSLSKGRLQKENMDGTVAVASSDELDNTSEKTATGESMKERSEHHNLKESSVGGDNPSYDADGDDGSLHTSEDNMPLVSSKKRNRDDEEKEKEDGGEKVGERHRGKGSVVNSASESSSPTLPPQSSTSGDNDNNISREQSPRWKIPKNERSVSDETKENSTILATPSTRGGTPQPIKHHPGSRANSPLRPPPSIGGKSHFSPSQESPLSELITTNAKNHREEQSEPESEHFPSPPPSINSVRSNNSKKAKRRFSPSQESLISEHPTMIYEEEPSEPQTECFPTPPTSPSENRTMAQLSPSQEPLMEDRPPSPQREQSEPHSEYFPSPPSSAVNKVPARLSPSQESLTSEHPTTTNDGERREQSEPQSEHLPTPPDSLCLLDCNDSNQQTNSTPPGARIHHNNSNAQFSNQQLSRSDAVGSGYLCGTKKKKQPAVSRKESPGSVSFADSVVEETCLPPIPDPYDSINDDMEQSDLTCNNLQPRIRRNRRPVDVDDNYIMENNECATGSDDEEDDDDSISVVYGTAADTHQSVPECETDPDIIVHETLVEADEFHTHSDWDMSELRNDSINPCALHCDGLRATEEKMTSDENVMRNGSGRESYNQQTKHRNEMAKHNKVLIHCDGLDKAELKMLRRLLDGGLCPIPSTVIHHNPLDKDDESRDIFDVPQHFANAPPAGHMKNDFETKWFITHATKKRNIFLSGFTEQKHGKHSFESTDAGRVPSNVGVCNRTFDYLRAVASGMHIIDAKVLQDSMNAEKWLLSEDQYKIWCDHDLYEKLSAATSDQSSHNNWLEPRKGSQGFTGINTICRSSPLLSGFVLLVVPDLLVSSNCPPSSGSMTCFDGILKRMIQNDGDNATLNSTDQTNSDRPTSCGYGVGLNSSSLTNDQVKELIGLLGGAVVADGDEPKWKYPTRDVHRLIIVPDGLSPDQLLTKLLKYCLSPTSCLPLDSWIDDYDPRIDSLEKSDAAPAHTHRMPIVTSSWLLDSISACTIAPTNEYCCGVLCWR